MYGANKNVVFYVEGFVDADYTIDLDKRRYLASFLFKLNACTINCKASLQNVVALSITEAEYIAAAKVIKQAIWLKGMMTKFGFEQKQITIYCDNQSCGKVGEEDTHR